MQNALFAQKWKSFKKLVNFFFSSSSLTTNPTGKLELGFLFDLINIKIYSKTKYLVCKKKKILPRSVLFGKNFQLLKERKKKMLQMIF